MQAMGQLCRPLFHIRMCAAVNGPLTSKASVDSLPPRSFRLLPGGTQNLLDGTCTR